MNVLTESDWARVLRIRIKSKRGESLSDEDRTLITAAHKSDPNRYKAFDREIFEATLPAGSSVKWRER